MSLEHNLLYKCDFEVFGKVQGVGFRRHTFRRAVLLGIKGWCMNTLTGSVKGQMEGTFNNITQMQRWLQTKGSPSAQIKKTIFTPLRAVQEPRFTEFAIKKL